MVRHCCIESNKRERLSRVMPLPGRLHGERNQVMAIPDLDFNYQVYNHTLALLWTYFSLDICRIVSCCVPGQVDSWLTYMFRNYLHENSASTTNPKPKGQSSHCLLRQAYSQQKAEPLRCLALRTKGACKACKLWSECAY